MTWRRTKTTERHYGGWGGYDSCQRRIALTDASHRRRGRKYPDGCRDAPLVNLARIEALHLLPDLYDTVVLPVAVWDEVVVEGEGQPGAHRVRTAAWIERRTVTNRDLVRALRQDLDAGEAEAIALAIETEDALLVMDERHGRETASHFKIPHLGLIGVLIDAKESRHIGAIQPHLDALKQEAGFWISNDLYRRVLRDEGELS